MVDSEIIRSKRDAQPVHYIWKINSFTKFSEIVAEIEEGKFESDEFEASGYKWKLVLYPNGNGTRNVDNHISMYLASTDKYAISSRCHVDVLVSFFVYDHIRDKYLTVQNGKRKRYNVLRTEHGFDQLLPLATFNDSSNGYLVDDCCIFGAEVNVIRNTVKANEFSLIRSPPDGTFIWKIDNFSTLENKEHYSEVFSVCGCKWKLLLYPSGVLKVKDKSMSLFLCLDENTLQYAEFKLSIKDQVNGIHHEYEAGRWFRNPSSANCWGRGFISFMLLEDLRNASKGFLVNDSLVIEAKITLISVSQNHLIS